MDLTPGALVLGKYELERQIGVGGMGEVWAAVQRPTRKRVALKFLRPGKGDESPAEATAIRKRFLREARAACAVQHPNVVEVHDVLELADGSPVMVMEYLHGESFEARLAAAGKLPLGEVAAILARVSAAVGTAHALGIVHRDLKPDNIFLAQTPDGIDVKVLDFGIAKLTALDGDAAQTGGLTNTGAMLGTPYYMSPEQAFGERNIDRRADVWSLGIILYRALTGLLPTRAENIGQILKIIMMDQIRPIAEVAPELPPDVLDLIARMLSSKREGRPSDLREVNEVLARHAGLEVASFGPPAELPPGEPTAGAITPGPTPPPAAPPPTAEGALSVAGVATATRPSPSRRGPFLALGAALVGGLAVAWFALGRAPSVDADATAGSTPAAQAPAAPSSDPTPGTTATPSTPSAPSAALADAPAAGSAPSVTPSASASAPPTPGRPAGAVGGPLPGSRPPPSGSGAGAAATAAPAAPTGAPRADAPSMGGVIATPPQF